MLWLLQGIMFILFGIYVTMPKALAVLSIIVGSLNIMYIVLVMILKFLQTVSDDVKPSNSTIDVRKIVGR